jgi:8-oxo-dGTP pyrophosphatase MutT (NUDIX family)
MTLLRHIEACNRFDPDDFVPFAISGEPIGRVRPESAAHLRSTGLADEGADGGVSIDGPGFVAISATLAEIVDSLASAGLSSPPRGEMTPVLRRWGEGALGQIDRAGLPTLGLPAFGVHVNGFVRGEAGLHLWVGRRAGDRLVAPGKFDHLVAGGVPMGYTAWETLVKEADEEAGLSADIARTARPVGAISYRLALPEGLRNDTLFVYDLELSADVTPRSNDGEVAYFELWPMTRVIETLRETDDFKFNVNLVLIDFLVRHGFIDPDREADYARLIMGLRR